MSLEKSFFFHATHLICKRDVTVCKWARDVTQCRVTFRAHELGTTLPSLKAVWKNTSGTNFLKIYLFIYLFDLHMIKID